MKNAIAAVAVLSAFAAAPALAQSSSEIGTLTCKVNDVSNSIVYTTQTFDCNFAPTGGGSEFYTGKITSIGLDLSVKKDFTIVWAVLAPKIDANKPRALAGTYVGGSADVALGAGMGAKILVGGGDNSITLQPVSISGVEGAGASIGVQSFKLD